MSYFPLPRADRGEVFDDSESGRPRPGFIGNYVLGDDFLPGTGDERTTETSKTWVMVEQKAADHMHVRLSPQHPEQAALYSDSKPLPVFKTPLIIKEFLPWVGLES